MASAASTRMSRDDYKKAKELEELRKTGAAPPAVDDEGKMINPHIPQYISSAPWYLNSTKPGLKHQYTKHFKTSGDAKFADVHTFYAKGAATKRKAGDIDADAAGDAGAGAGVGAGGGRRPLKFAKDACANCGAATHKTKECLERTRKRGAKLTGENVAADDVVQNLQFDYEGKRDRWNGYDSSTYQRVIDQYERTEAERKAAKKREVDEMMATKRAEKADAKLKRKEERRKEKEAARAAKKEAKAKKREAKAAELAAAAAARDAAEKGSGSIGADGAKKPAAAAAALSTDSDSASDVGSDSDSDSDSDADEDGVEKEAEGMEDKGQLIQGLDTKRGKTSVRNLRLREDTAKYLRNLNINSAHYDPKTRSMRENPHTGKDPKDLLYAGDNWVRHSGDAKAITDAQRFVWDANDRGVEDINILSNPSQAEAMFKQYQEKREKLKDKRKDAVLSKYGGEQHIAKDDAERDLLLMQSEHYVEYSEDGRVVKGQEKAIPKSKYVEDVLENKHTAIWGSFYDLQTGKWGYACCQQTTRHAFCTGEAGKAARAEMAAELARKRDAPFKPVVAEQVPGAPAPGSGAASASSSSSSSSASASGSVGARGGDKDKLAGRDLGSGLVRAVHGGDSKEYQDRLSAAIKAERARQQRTDDDDDARSGAAAAGGGKKGRPKYSSQSAASAVAPTDEEMEAHKMLTIRADDPMAKFLKG